MEPTRKSRRVNDRFLREVSSDKDVGNLKSSSRPRRKKLSDMLGPQWCKKDLERCFEAYRKHGRDWRKCIVWYESYRKSLLSRKLHG